MDRNVIEELLRRAIPEKLQKQQADFAAGITKLPMMLPASGFRDSSGCKRRER
jgi:hypothetical protein